MINNYLQILAGQQDANSAFSSIPSDIIHHIGVFCSDIILSRFGNNWQIDKTKPNTARECELSCRKFTSFIPMCKPDTIFQAQCDLSEKEFRYNPHLQENSLGKPIQLVEFIREIKDGEVFIEKNQKIIYDPEYTLFNTYQIEHLEKQDDYHSNARTLVVITLPIKTRQNIKINITLPKDIDDQTCEKIKSFAIYCINKISDYIDNKTTVTGFHLLNDKIRSIIFNLKDYSYSNMDILERLMSYY